MRFIERRVLVAVFMLSAIITVTTSTNSKSCGSDHQTEKLKQFCPAGQNENAEFKMELIHTNDMHSRFEQTSRMSGVCSPLEEEQEECFGGFARVATVIKEARAKAEKGETPPVLVLNAGDNFQGSIYYTLFSAEIVTKFINMLQFDALTLGNHEYDDGPVGLEPYLRGITSPIVAANVDHSKCPELQNINLPPSVVLDVGGQKIGVIGSLTQDSANVLSPSSGVVITDGIAAVKKEAARLSDQGIKIIIALSHLGYPVDKQLAYEVPEVDLVIGGHTHTFLYNENEGELPDPVDLPKGPYPTFITQSSGRVVPVVQAFRHTKYIGRLSLAFDADGEMTSITGKPLLLDKNVPEDPVFLEELKTWKNKLTCFVNNVEGFTPVFLNRADCRYRECMLGKVVTDAYVHYMTKLPTIDKTNTWPDVIALVNAGNLRNSIDAKARNGEVTLRDIIEALPIRDVICAVKLKGDVLLEVLEHSVSKYDPNLIMTKGAFLQVSGLKVEYNIDKPSGQRVEKVLVRCSKCDIPGYSPLQNDQTYLVLMPYFMGRGLDGFTMIANKGEVLLFDEHSQATVVATYFNEKSPVIPDAENRILVKLNDKFV